MSLKQLGNYKMESKSYGANREVRARKKLKKFRKKWLRKQPCYMVKYFKDYEYQNNINMNFWKLFKSDLQELGLTEKRSDLCFK